MLVAGIDEAGRGCVIGPLVIAGILAKQENLSVLTNMGIKDSKLLTSKKRDTLYPKITHIAEKYVILKITPQQIDRAVKSNIKLQKLNYLEAQTMAQIITQLQPDIAYVDAADVIAERFALNIQACAKFKTKIISKHKADITYPVVSAASILAKVERDREIQKLHIKFGDFGSGYLTDPKTPLFLHQWLKKEKNFPECVRQSWKPAILAKNQRGTTQTTL